MIESGQVLSLKIRFNNSGSVASVAHPVLVVDVDNDRNIIEIAHIDYNRRKKVESLVKK